MFHSFAHSITRSFNHSIIYEVGIIQRQTLRGTAFTYAGIGIGFVTAGLLQPKLLTQAENGLIGLLAALSVILTQLSNLGINSAGGRFFPYFRDYERGHGGFLRLAAGVCVLGFAISAGVVWMLQPQMVAANAQKSALFVQYYYLLLPLTFCTLFFSVFDTYARLLYNPVTGTFLQQFGQRFVFLLSLLGYALGWLNFQALIWTWLGSYFLILLAMIGQLIIDGHISLTVRRKEPIRVPPGLGRSLARYAGLSLLTGLSSQVILQIDKYLVNDSLGLAQTGVYTILSNFGLVIAAPATMLFKASGVIIADSWKANDRQNIADIYRKSCLSQLIAGTLVFVGIAVNLPNLFAILPPAYAGGGAVVLWIGLGKLIDMATGVNGTILSTSRYYAWDSLFFVGMVALTIVSTRALIPVFGLEGAAIGAVLATAAFNAARTGFVWYKFDLQPFSWHNVIVLLVGGAVWAVVARVPYFSGDLWRVMFDAAGRSALVAGLFVGLVYALRLSPDVNDLLRGLSRRFIKPKP
jgi:O-antigen/teichoic acid export membrane protein